MKRLIILTLLLLMITGCRIPNDIFSPQKILDSTLGPPIRFFYVEDYGTEHSDEVEADFIEQIKKSQEYLADEMERHGYGRRTFALSTWEIQRINVSQHESFYIDDFYSLDVSPRDFCDDHSLPNSEWQPLREELESMTKPFSGRQEICIYFVSFPIHCAMGRAYTETNNIIMYAQYQYAFNYDRISFETLTHEIVHILGLPHDSRENNLMNSVRHPDKEGSYILYPDQAKYINDFN